MNRMVIVALGLTLMVAAAGCGKKEAANQAKPAASGSKYDSGPRAGESAFDHELAEAGEKLFQLKGCSACHTWGKKMSGPDLAGVTMRRTAQWMENQILHPEVMTKEDPISRDLMAKMALQMPNQGVKPDEARALIEFLKSKDQAMGASHEAHESEGGKKR